MAAISQACGSTAHISEIIDSEFISLMVLDVHYGPVIGHIYTSSKHAMTTRLHDVFEMPLCCDADYSRDCEWWESFCDVPLFEYAGCDE